MPRLMKIQMWAPEEIAALMRGQSIQTAPDEFHQAERPRKARGVVTYNGEVSQQTLLPPPAKEQITCSICGHVFAHKGWYNLHMKNKHSQAHGKLHHCKYPGCSKTFTSVNAVGPHMKIHYNQQKKGL